MIGKCKRCEDIEAGGLLKTTVRKPIIKAHRCITPLRLMAKDNSKIITQFEKHPSYGFIPKKNGDEFSINGFKVGGQMNYKEE